MSRSPRIRRTRRGRARSATGGRPGEPPPAEPPSVPPAGRWKTVLLLTALCFVFVGATHGLDGSELAKGYDWQERFTFQRDLVYQAWESGVFPLWCPYTFGGRPFYAEPEPMAFYPATWVWPLLPKDQAHVVDTLLHYFLAALFAFLFVRTLGARPAIALVAATAYAFCGFNYIHTGAGHVNFHAAVAWLPLIFLCVEKAVEGRPSFWLTGAAVLGLQFFANSMPVFWMTGLFASLYAIVRSAIPFGMRRFLTRLAGLAVMITLGLGVSAIQFVPAMEFAGLSVRPPDSFEYAAFLSMPPRNLANLVFPRGKVDGPDLTEEEKLIPIAEYNGYIGILPLGLGLAGMTLMRRRQIPALAIVGALALLLALGDSTPAFRLFYHLIPGVSSFRMHCREILVFSFSLICAGAVAAEEFARSPRSRALDRVALVGAGAVVVWVALSLVSLHGNPTAPAWQLVLIGLSLAGIWVMRRGAASVFALTIVLGLVFVDVTVNAANADTYYFQVRAPPPATEEAISKVLREDRGFFRAFFHKRAYRRERFIEDRFPTVDGYEAMIPRNWYEFIHEMTNAPIKPELVTEATQNMFSMRSTPFPFRILNVKYTTLYEPQGHYRLLVNPHPSPRAWLASEPIVIADRTTAMARLRSPDFDPIDGVILDDDDGAGPAGTARSGVPRPPEGGRTLSSDGRVCTTPAGVSRIESMGLNSVRLSVDASVPSILVLSEGWYPGWTVTVDGRNEKLLRADVVLRGVRVPPGSHEVVFTFAPRVLVIGAAITLLALLGLALGGALLTRRTRSATP